MRKKSLTCAIIYLFEDGREKEREKGGAREIDIERE